MTLNGWTEKPQEGRWRREHRSAAARITPDGSARAFPRRPRGTPVPPRPARHRRPRWACNWPRGAEGLWALSSPQCQKAFISPRPSAFTCVTSALPGSLPGNKALFGGVGEVAKQALPFPVLCFCSSWSSTGNKRPPSKLQTVTFYFSLKTWFKAFPPWNVRNPNTPLHLP